VAKVKNYTFLTRNIQVISPIKQWHRHFYTTDLFIDTKEQEVFEVGKYVIV